MTDNPKVKSGKAVHGNAKVATHTLRSDVNTSLHQLQDAGVKAKKVSEDAKTAAQAKLKRAEVKAKNVSEDVKTGIRKAVSDAKIAPHGAGSKLKKR
jgi:hypothetical protein